MSQLNDANDLLKQKIKEQTEALIQSNKIQTAFYKIADAASNSHDLQEFFARIHGIVGELMYAENFFIALYNESTGLLSFPYFVDEMDEPFPTQRLDDFHGMTSYVIRTGEPIRHGWDQFDDLVAEKEVELAGSYNEDGIGAPLKADGKVLGAIFVQSYTKGVHYTDQDDEVLAFVAQHIATALIRMRALEAERQRNAELAILNSLSEAMSKTLDVKTVTRIVGDKLRDIFGSETVCISLLDPQTNLIITQYEFDKAEGGYVDQIVEPYPLGAGLNSKVITSRQPLLLGTYQEEVANGAYFPPELVEQSSGLFTESWLGAPILAGDQVLGVVNIGAYQQYAFNEYHLRLLQTLSATMGAAIKNARLFQAEQQRNAELEIINNVGAALARQLDPEAIIALVGEQLRAVFPGQMCSIAVYDEAADLIRWPYFAGFEGEQIPQQPVRLGLGLTSHVIRSRQPLVLGTLEEAVPYGAVWIYDDLEREPRSWIGIPVLVGDQAIGVLAIQDLPEHRYGENDVRLLATLASSMGIALENARLYVDARQRAGQMAALAEAGREISASHDLPAIMGNITRRAHKVCKARTTVLRLVEPDGQLYRARVALGLYAEQFQADAVRPGEGITGAVILSGIPEIIPNTEKDPRVVHVRGTPEEEEQPETMMAAPLVARDQTVGVITLYRWATEGQFTQVDLDFLSGLARQAAISIENARLFNEVQRQKEYLETLLENSPVAIITGDNQFRVKTWNQGAEKLFGYTAQEAIGQNLNDLVANHPDLFAEARAFDQHNMSGGTVHAVTRRTRKDGSLCDVEIIGEMVVVDEQHLGFITIYHDLSGPKRAEAALSKAKAEAEAANEAKSILLDEIRAMLEAIDYGVLLLDENLCARIGNRAFREMWGLTEEFITGAPTLAEMIDYNRATGVYDVPAERWEDYVARRVEAVRQGAISPTQFRRRDGHILRYQALVLPGGGRMLTYFDITDLVHQNEYLAALHETTLGLISRLDLTDLLETLITRAGQLLNAPHGFLYFLEAGQSEMECKVGVGAPSALVGSRIKPGEGLAGRSGRQASRWLLMITTPGLVVWISSSTAWCAPLWAYRLSLALRWLASSAWVMA